MAFPNIEIERGTTLNPIAMVLWDDTAQTIRTVLTGSLPVALVKDRQGNVIVDLEPTIELAADYFPEVNDGAGGPLSGDVIAFSLTDEQTALLEVGGFRWDLINEYSNGEKQLIIAGRFQIDITQTLG